LEYWKNGIMGNTQKISIGIQGIRIKNILTNQSIIEKTLFRKISPVPSLPKRGNSSLLQREERRD